MEISTNYLSDIETQRGWVSPFSLAKLANALEIEVFELFKPGEKAPDEVRDTINKCLEVFSTSLKVSFDKALADSISQIQRNL